MAKSGPLVFTIRKAVSGDESGILDCLRMAFEPYRSDYTPEAFRDTVLSPETITRGWRR